MGPKGEILNCMKTFTPNWYTTVLNMNTLLSGMQNGTKRAVRKTIGCFLIKLSMYWEFPGSPVVWTPHFH